MKYSVLKKFSWIFVVAVLVLINCQKERISQPEIVARVGDREITLNEFRTFYELDPDFGIQSRGYHALRDEMDRYVNRVLALSHYQQNSKEADSMFAKAEAWESRQATLRELYRQVVEKDVKVTENELRDAYLQNNIQVHVRHLFSKDSSQVNRWSRQLKKGKTFEELARIAFADSVLASNGGDLGWQTVGALDADFAEAVMKLQANQISGPVKTRWGYHLIQLLDKKAELIVSEEKFKEQRPSLEKQIKRRKSREMSQKFINDFIGKLNPQPVRKTFRLLWQSCVPPEQKARPLDQPVYFTNQYISRLTQKLKAHLNDPLVAYRAGSFSLSDYLRGLREIPLSERPRFKSPRQLSNKLGIWVRDEILYQEAQRRGLQNHKIVKKEVREFLEEQAYLDLIRRELQVEEMPDWVKRYFENKDRSVLEAHPELTNYHTIQAWSWDGAEETVGKMLRSESSLLIWVDEDLLKKENALIDWHSRIRVMAIRKPE